jgi:molecular chaperone GrpE
MTENHDTHDPQVGRPGADGTSDPAAGDLAARLTKAERQREEYLLLARQTQADFENYQKRAARDREQERRYAQSPLALALLPALDNLERALAAARQAGDNGPLVQGVALVQSQLLDALRRNGVTPIEAKGQPFDPNKHEAVMQQPSADQPPGTVLQVLQPGYQLHDRVLRPASVVVSIPAQSPASPAGLDEPTERPAAPTR